MNQDPGASRGTTPGTPGIHWMGDKNADTETVPAEEQGTGSQVSKNTVAGAGKQRLQHKLMGITQFGICLCKGQCQEKLPGYGRRTLTKKAEQLLTAAVRVDLLTGGQRCWTFLGWVVALKERAVLVAQGCRWWREGGPVVHPLHGEKALWLLLVVIPTALDLWYPQCTGAVGLVSPWEVQSWILVHPQPSSYAKGTRERGTTRFSAHLESDALDTPLLSGQGAMKGGRCSRRHVSYFAPAYGDVGEGAGCSLPEIGCSTPAALQNLLIITAGV